MNKENRVKKKNNVKSYFILFVSALCTAIILRIFVLDVYKIPSNSMAPEINKGDYVIVNKLIFGARIIKSYDYLKSQSRPDIWRMKKCRSIKRNDILVFNFPYIKRNKLSLDPNQYYMKRCIAIPGDTLYIKNGIYRVNNCMDTLGNYKMQVMLSHKGQEDFPQNSFQCFPKKSTNFYWTIKEFGPLYIPRKEEKLKINCVNIDLYKNLIEYETSRKIKTIDNQVYLNDRLITEYRFKVNYYFMAGDNVLNSRDSRYWGLLPEDHIIGEASLLWKSKR